MNCPKCGANNPENTNQCLRCGTFFNSVPQMGGQANNQRMPQQGVPQQMMGQQMAGQQMGMQQGMNQGGMPVNNQGMPQQGVPQQMMGQQMMGQPQMGMQQGMNQGGMPVNNQGMPQQGVPQQMAGQQMGMQQGMQGTQMPQLVNVQQATQQNINSLYANTPVANKNRKEIDQKTALGIYMGDKSNKIQAGNNLAAAGLGSIWFFYRKMYTHGIVVAILEVLGYSLSRGLAIPLFIFLIIRFLFLLFAANIFYTNKSIKKVEKMQFTYDNTDMTTEVYKAQLKKAGGVSLAMGLLGSLVFSTGISLAHSIVPEKYYFKMETINVRAKSWVAAGDNKIVYEDANGICTFEEVLYTESTITTFLQEHEFREEDRTANLKVVQVGTKSYDSYEISGGGNKYKVIEINDGGIYKSILLGYGKTSEESSACLKKIEKLIPEIELKDEASWW